MRGKFGTINLVTTSWNLFLYWTLNNHFRGNIKLLQPLDYEVEQHRTIYVTATDESHVSYSDINVD